MRGQSGISFLAARFLMSKLDDEMLDVSKFHDVHLVHYLSACFKLNQSWGCMMLKMICLIERGSSCDI